MFVMWLVLRSGELFWLPLSERTWAFFPFPPALLAKQERRKLWYVVSYIREQSRMAILLPTPFALPELYHRHRWIEASLHTVHPPHWPGSRSSSSRQRPNPMATNTQNLTVPWARCCCHETHCCCRMYRCRALQQYHSHTNHSGVAWWTHPANRIYPQQALSNVVQRRLDLASRFEKEAGTKAEQESKSRGAAAAGGVLYFSGMFFRGLVFPPIKIHQLRMIRLFLFFFRSSISEKKKTFFFPQLNIFFFVNYLTPFIRHRSHSAIPHSIHCCCFHPPPASAVCCSRTLCGRATCAKLPGERESPEVSGGSTRLTVVEEACLGYGAAAAAAAAI